MEYPVEFRRVIEATSIADHFVKNEDVPQEAKEEKMDNLMQEVKAVEKQLDKLNNLFWHLANNVKT